MKIYDKIKFKTVLEVAVGLGMQAISSVRCQILPFQKLLPFFSRSDFVAGLDLAAGLENYREKPCTPASLI